MRSKPALVEKSCCTDKDNPCQEGLLGVFFRNQDHLKRIIAGMGLSAVDAEDVLQDVSIKALNNKDQPIEPGKSLAWLAKVTVNRCLTEHRRRKSFLAKTLQLLGRKLKNNKAASEPDKNAVFNEEKMLIHAALSELDKKMLTVLVLRYFCDMNATQISEILKITPSAVRNRISRARELLAEKLKKRGVRP